MTPMRATLPDDVRAQMVAFVMRRDGVGKEEATRIVNAMAPSSLIRLELEAAERRQPAFTADYDPFARG